MSYHLFKLIDAVGSLFPSYNRRQRRTRNERDDYYLEENYNSQTGKLPKSFWENDATEGPKEEKKP